MLAGEPERVKENHRGPMIGMALNYMLKQSSQNLNHNAFFCGCGLIPLSSQKLTDPYISHLNVT